MNFEPSPENMTGAGESHTLRVRGGPAKPTKKVHMVLPPDVQTEADLKRFVEADSSIPVHEIALEDLRRNK